MFFNSSRINTSTIKRHFHGPFDEKFICCRFEGEDGKKRFFRKRESEVYINGLCTLDPSKIQLENLLTALTMEKMEDINIKLSKYLEL